MHGEANAMMPGWMMGGGWWGPGSGLFGWLFMLLFWVFIIVGAVLLIRWLMDETRSTGSARHETALDILKQRYAKGELAKEQFEAMKRELR
jgi:putative membrane protein